MYLKLCLIIKRSVEAAIIQINSHPEHPIPILYTWDASYSTCCIHKNSCQHISFLIFKSSLHRVPSETTWLLPQPDIQGLVTTGLTSRKLKRTSIYQKAIMVKSRVVKPLTSSLPVERWGSKRWVTKVFNHCPIKFFLICVFSFDYTIVLERKKVWPDMWPKT